MLMDVLHDLYQAHMEMIELANQKKQVLIEGNLKELSKIIQLESSWVKRVGKLEEERMKVIQSVVQEKGLPFQEVAMTDLITFLTSPEEKEQMKDILGKLSKTVEEMKRVNEFNTQLVQQSLDFIDHSYAILLEDNKDSITYSNPKSKLKSKQNQSIFDQRA